MRSSTQSNTTTAQGLRQLMFNTQDVTRSSNSKYKHNDQIMAGVGARQGNINPHLEGGGYLDNCNVLKLLKNDFCEISDLKKMGLNQRWVSLAERLGVEAFLMFWQEMSHQTMNLDDDRRIKVPKYTAFLRYQRDKVIRTLKAEGKSRTEIACYLKANLQTTISLSQITRVLNG